MGGEAQRWQPHTEQGVGGEVVAASHKIKLVDGFKVFNYGVLRVSLSTYNNTFCIVSSAIIGPPSVTVTPRNRSITLKLKAPSSPYKRKKGSKISMAYFYHLLYQVFLINNLPNEVSACSLILYLLKM